jgi:hypothetical protein
VTLTQLVVLGLAWLGFNLVGVVIWSRLVHKACPRCHGTGMCLTEADYLKATGFQMPEGPPCGQCEGTGAA